MATKEPNRNMYVGHRYVPKIMGEWDSTIPYEGLCIVLHQGNSYTSTGRVPVGIPIDNETYWKVTGNYNAQVEYYRQEVALVKDTVDDIMEDLGTLDDNLNSIVINVLHPPEPLVAAKGDGVTNDTPAIREIIKHAPNGATIEFPPVNEGYLLKHDVEKYLILIDQPVKIRGKGVKSLLSIDSAVPEDVDVFLVKPKGSSDSMKRGYSIQGMSVAPKDGVKSARHVVHFDVTNPDFAVANSEFTHNIFWGTGGYSFFLTNPTGTTSFFGNQLQKNLLFGGMFFDRCGDSVTVTENVIAGTNDVSIGLIDGSNTFVFTENNVTSRGGMIVKSGHNIKIRDNNFESGYADSVYPNGAILDIDGSETPKGWGLLTVEVTGNNFTFRPDSPDVSSIRINKARGTKVEGNHIARKIAADQILITALASDTIIGYNLFSSDKPEGYILDEGRNTLIKDRVTINPLNGKREYINYEAAFLHEKVTHKHNVLDRNEYEPKTGVNTPAHNYIWSHVNTFPSKHRVFSQQRLTDGKLDAEKQIYTVGDGYINFAPETFMLMDSLGFKWKVIVSTSGALSTVRVD